MIDIDHVKKIGLSKSIIVLYYSFRVDLQDYFIVSKCDKCNLIFGNSYSSFEDSNCSCSVIDSSYSSLLSQSLLKFGDIFDYSLEKFSSMSIKMDIFCKVCKRTFSRSPIKNLKSIGCPFCKSSRGEKKIYAYLDSRGIKFIKNYTDPSLKDKKKLLIDAMCFINGKVHALEYNGIQHYEQRFWTKNENVNRLKYLDTVNKDKIKAQWCSDNNIPLLVIPYWDYDRIEEILDVYFGFK